MLLLTLPFVGEAQAAKNKRLAAYLQTKQFSAPEIGNYIELHFQFLGYTLNYVEQGEDLIGEVAVIMDITQNGAVVEKDAYRLNTPVMVNKVVDDFYDIKRVALAPGVYTCNLELLDMNNSKSSVTTSFVFTVEDLTDAISISDILIAESAYVTEEMTHFYKSGYNILPRISTFYPTELSSMPVYFEVYNSDLLTDSTFSVRQQLVNGTTGAVIPAYTYVTKHKTDKVVPIFKTVNLTDLPTGPYQLQLAVFDRKNNELSTQTYDFERSNDMEQVINTHEIILDPHFQGSITEDSVQYYLASLIPISGSVQTSSIMKTLRLKDRELSRKMIQGIWKEIDPVNTYEAWMKYKEQVQFVQSNFKTNFQPGFETDRGRVYLQYGAPSRTLEREMSAAEYPYEMWEYNKIGIYSNKKFIFYNPDLVNNNYKLLHSDMIGELQNNRWQYELSKRNTVNGNVDDPNQFNSSSWGNNSRQLLGN